MIWLLVLAAVLFLTIPLVGRAFGFALDFWRSIL